MVNTIVIVTILILVQAASATNSDNEDSADPFLSDAIHVTSTLSLQEYFASKMAAKRSSSNLLEGISVSTPSPNTDTGKCCSLYLVDV